MSDDDISKPSFPYTPAGGLVIGVGVWLFGRFVIRDYANFFTLLGLFTVGSSLWAIIKQRS